MSAGKQQHAQAAFRFPPKPPRVPGVPLVRNPDVPFKIDLPHISSPPPTSPHVQPGRPPAPNRMSDLPRDLASLTVSPGDHPARVSDHSHDTPDVTGDSRAPNKAGTRLAGPGKHPKDLLATTHPRGQAATGDTASYPPDSPFPGFNDRWRKSLNDLHQRVKAKLVQVGHPYENEVTIRLRTIPPAARGGSNSDEPAVSSGPHLVVSIGVGPGSLGENIARTREKATFVANETRQSLLSVFRAAPGEHNGFNEDNLPHVEVYQVTNALFSDHVQHGATPPGPKSPRPMLACPLADDEPELLDVMEVFSACPSLRIQAKFAGPYYQSCSSGTVAMIIRMDDGSLIGFTSRHVVIPDIDQGVYRYGKVAQMKGVEDSDVRISISLDIDSKHLQQLEDLLAHYENGRRHVVGHEHGTDSDQYRSCLKTIEDLRSLMRDHEQRQCLEIGHVIFAPERAAIPATNDLLDVAAILFNDSAKAMLEEHYQILDTRRIPRAAAAACIVKHMLLNNVDLAAWEAARPAILDRLGNQLRLSTIDTEPKHGDLVIMNGRTSGLQLGLLSTNQVVFGCGGLEAKLFPVSLLSGWGSNIGFGFAGGDGDKYNFMAKKGDSGAGVFSLTTGKLVGVMTSGYDDRGSDPACIMTCDALFRGFLDEPYFQELYIEKGVDPDPPAASVSTTPPMVDQDVE